MAGRGAKSGKKAAKTYERPGLSDEEIEEIKEAFNLFDTDGSGTFRRWHWQASVLWEPLRVLTPTITGGQCIFQDGHSNLNLSLPLLLQLSP
tara:strand:+ start:200 stop:475 length:276 start_codon:yes stop_codon:yes gene_type:complete